jgi:signal transduction histidine kinase/ActR/RegA family two-component response regulator
LSDETRTQFRAAAPVGRRRIFVAVVAVILVLLGGALYWMIEAKVAGDMKLAGVAFRRDATLRAEDAAGLIDGKLRQIHQGLRTIGLLPTVQRIERHGEHVEGDAAQTIQQLYNNLKLNVDISEVYVVAVDFNPDRIDPVTGQSEEPILSFDQLISESSTESDDDAVEADKPPEVEIEEYRELAKQLSWLQRRFPTADSFDMFERPMLSSEEVITCDNTVYNPTGQDVDRKGIMLSVPFYDKDGKLRGVVSATVRKAALAGYLPRSDFALINAGHGFSVLSPEAGVQLTSLAYAKRGEPDPDLPFSTAVELSQTDPQGNWILWTGRSADVFLNSPQVVSIRTFEITALIIGAMLMIVVIAVLVMMRSGARLQKTRQAHLQEIADARAAQIGEMEMAQAAIAEREAKAVRLANELEANQEKLRAMLTDLMAAKDAAEAASVAKSQFLAIMSHEIRTPLNGVLGLAQVMASERLETEQAEKIDLILEAGQSLLVLLNDVLDLSKIEAGKLEITTAPGDVAQTISGTVQLFRAQAEGKGLALSFGAPESLPLMHHDPVRVRQCVSNLISNAIKFTATGSVAVTVSAKANGADEQMVMVRVRDTGIGMNETAMSRLFSAFTQGDNSTTRRFGGTGLGLAISRALARKMGGDIRVRSKEGVGSSFVLLFRAQEAPLEIFRPVATAVVRAGAYENDTLRGARILLTDDNALNRKIIRLMLTPLGCEITEAANGQEALDQLAAQTFDLVLLDAHMPVMDGVEAIRRIRTTHEHWRTLPVIALTADAMAGDRDKYLAMGMSEYLSKPVDKHALIATMSGLLVPGSQVAPVRALTGT